MHIGSGTDLEHLSQVSGAMEKAAHVVGPTLTTISAGGGLPTPYRDGDQRVDIAAYFDLWDATRNRLATAFGNPISLEIEPGRYLAAESGSLIAEIRAIKQMGKKPLLPTRRRVQRFGTPDFVWILPPDGGLPC